MVHPSHGGVVLARALPRQLRMPHRPAVRPSAPPPFPACLKCFPFWRHTSPAQRLQAWTSPGRRPPWFWVRARSVEPVPGCNHAASLHTHTSPKGRPLCQAAPGGTQALRQAFPSAGASAAETGAPWVHVNLHVPCTARVPPLPFPWRHAASGRPLRPAQPLQWPGQAVKATACLFKGLRPCGAQGWVAHMGRWWSGCGGGGGTPSRWRGFAAQPAVHMSLMDITMPYGALGTAVAGSAVWASRGQSQSPCSPALRRTKACSRARRASVYGLITFYILAASRPAFPAFPGDFFVFGAGRVAQQQGGVASRGARWRDGALARS
jgi:hypothetical protein